MAKELKHCKSVEDLECNDNVKQKARDYIHKYMSRYGPLYRKEKSISFDEWHDLEVLSTNSLSVHPSLYDWYFHSFDRCYKYDFN